MLYNKPVLAMLLSSLTLVSACSALPKSALPPVLGAETCPRPPQLPEELLLPMQENFLSGISSSLTDYFSLELKPTKQLGNATSR